MGPTKGQLQERVLQLERMNRMQAVEIWQLKEERRDLEMKVESLLNTDQCLATAGGERKVSFGPVLYSDGGKKVVEAEYSVGDVEEVEAVTLQDFGKSGEKRE